MRFHVNTQYILCSENIDKGQSGRSKWRQASILEISENWHQICPNWLANNDNDTRTRKATGRLENCKDVVTAEVMYHPTCHISFRHGRSFNAGGGKSKRPSSDLNILTCFQSTCEWFEGATEPRISL